MSVPTTFTELELKLAYDVEGLIAVGIDTSVDQIVTALVDHPS